MTEQSLAQHGTPLQLAFRRLRRNRMAMLSLGVLVVLVVLALFGPALSPYAYDYQDRLIGATAPSAAHWLGTDDLGRDLLARLLYGGRVSLAIGCCATAVSLLIGVLYGAVSGYCGGRIDGAMMRIVDVLYALPFTIFVIVLTVVFGRSFMLLFAAIGAVEWLTMARIVRAQVLSLRRQLFVTACEALG
jgi:oligopeptide transport system permease protein